MNKSRMLDVVYLCSCGRQLLGQGSALITKRIVFRRCYDSGGQAAKSDVQWAQCPELFSVHVRHPLLQRPCQGFGVQSPSRPFLLHTWLRQGQVGVGTNQQESTEADALRNQPLGREEDDQAPGAVAGKGRRTIDCAKDCRCLDCPFQCGDDVVNRRRCRMLGRSPIVDRQYRGVGFHGQPTTRPVMGIQVPENERTAVDVDDERQWLPVWPIETHRNRAVAWCGKVHYLGQAWPWRPRTGRAQFVHVQGRGLSWL